MKKTKKGLLPLLLLLLLFLSNFRGVLQAWETPFTPEGPFVYPPQEWVLLEALKDKATYADPEENCFLQIKFYPKEAFPRAEAIYTQVKSQLGAAGEGSPFLFAGQDAYFADLSFKAGGFPFRGYLVFVNSGKGDYVIMAIASEEAYEARHDFLLSALDSFSLNREGIRLPGPVSQYYTGTAPRQLEPADLPLAGRRYQIMINPADLEAAEFLIEREARVLATYTVEAGVPAWKRYYRLIYRENYGRIGAYAGDLEKALGLSGTSKEEKAKKLLSWMQGFTYTRTGSFSDLLSPLHTLLAAGGDCDARGLLYCLLLKHYGIEGILMVSSKYSHSVAALDLPGSGARFTLGDRAYLVAELTKPVALGLIASDMADPAGWIGIDF